MIYIIDENGAVLLMIYYYFRAVFHAERFITYEMKEKTNLTKLKMKTMERETSTTIFFIFYFLRKWWKNGWAKIEY